jgi:hypothetical protein
LEVLSYELKPDGQVSCKPAWQGNGWNSCQVDRYGKDVCQIKRKRVVDALTNPEGRNGHGGAGDDVNVIEGAQEVILYKRP